jgi:hypothetical protein
MRAMKSLRTLFAVVGALVLFTATAHADMAEGKLTQDITVGANHDIPLKTGQVVQIMNQNGGKTVIMLPLPDGSNGIFQIDSAAIQSVPGDTPLGLPAPPPPPPPAPGTVPPKYPTGFVGVPTFQTTQGDHAAGGASLITSGDKVYLVSTRELLGPQGGFSTQIAAKDVPDAVHNIQLAPYSGGSATYAVTGLAVRTGRLQADSGKPIDDVAIFQLPDATAKAQSVPLADKTPSVDDVIWVIARLRGSPPDQVGHRGKVIDNTTWLLIEFDEDSIHTGGISGAPVLNNDGALVGVLSTCVTEAGHIRAYVIPAKLIAETIVERH